MTEGLKIALQGNLDAYKSIPFWSWNNALDEEVLVKQIEQMQKEGIGGFIMHARIGLKEEYLGEKWFSCISACLKKARALQMEAWIYDENGWPSGFVGGKLLKNEDFRARFLEYELGEWDNNAFASYIEDEERGYVRVEDKKEGISKYHKVYLRISPANTDILNPAVTQAFIEETHEQYYARYAESFGKELAGFFTDEPQYYRWGTPYTPMAEAFFTDIRDGLIWLFKKDSRGYEFRQQYFGALNQLYVENFYKKLYDWCKAHGCKLTGHSVEEPYLFTQMWGGAAVMPSYEYEDIPAIDCLGREPMSEVSPKQVGSVSAQLGKKHILTETFACSGNDVTPKELKSIAESQYFHGVNKMCQHLYPYSMAGRGKTDHPPVFGPKGNWGKSFKIFNDYFTKLGYIVANTKEQVDIAILHPMRSIWLDYVRAEDSRSVWELESQFHELLGKLRKKGVTYHFLDERILARYGKAEGDNLRVGECTYNKVLVPDVATMSAFTYGLLQNYTGKLCVLSTPSYIDGKKADVRLRANVSLEELIKDTNIAFSCEDGNSVVTSRAGELGEFLFIKNLSMDKESKVYLKGCSSSYCALDLESLTERKISDTMTIEANSSVILVKSDEATPTVYGEEKKDVTKNFRVTEITDNYMVLDYAQISKDGGKTFGERYPIAGLFERLLREDYKGEIVVKQTFTVQEKMPLTFLMEQVRAKWAKLNGKQLTFTQNDFDVNFVQAEITPFVREGENQFIYAFDFWQHEGVHFALFDPLATESLRNCLYYDTSIEPTYLRGDFTVNADMVLCKRTELPPITGELAKRGYPFFKGELTLEGTIEWTGEGSVIFGIDGRFLVADMWVNGKERQLALDTKGEIADLLQKGSNSVKIVLRSSLRNLFGPLHFKPNPEPMSVSPDNFEMRGGWKDGYASNYTDDYNSVPFGAKSIYVIEKHKK